MNTDDDIDDYGNPKMTADDIAAARKKAEDFYLRVGIALSGCQLIEQQLKLYIAEAFKPVQKYIGKRMPFKMSGDDYERSPMRGLIKMFRTEAPLPHVRSRTRGYAQGDRYGVRAPSGSMLLAYATNAEDSARTANQVLPRGGLIKGPLIRSEVGTPAC